MMVMADPRRPRVVGSHPVFPVTDSAATARFYVDVLGFRAVEYLDAAEPHVCLYRDDVEIILTVTDRPVRPNRELYGYGFDAYFITADQDARQAEFAAAGATIVRPLARTDYHNAEFVVEGQRLTRTLRRRTGRRRRAGRVRDARRSPCTGRGSGSGGIASNRRRMPVTAASSGVSVGMGRLPPGPTR